MDKYDVAQSFEQPYMHIMQPLIHCSHIFNGSTTGFEFSQYFSTKVRSLLLDKGNQHSKLLEGKYFLD